MTDIVSALMLAKAQSGFRTARKRQFCRGTIAQIKKKYMVISIVQYDLLLIAKQIFLPIYCHYSCKELIIEFREFFIFGLNSVE